MADLDSQCIIDISQGAQRDAIAAYILSEKEEVRIARIVHFVSSFFGLTLLQLKKYSYGKHILAHLEKTMPDSNRVRLKFPLLLLLSMLNLFLAPRC